MRILDRYIMRQLITPILFCSATLVLLVLFADVFDRLDVFIKNKVPAQLLFRYYVALTPYTFVQTIPWATFLGTIYVLTMFNRFNELLAMKTAGVRATSIAGPMLFVGFIIGVATFIVNDRVVPKTYLQAERIRNEEIEKNDKNTKEGMLSNITYFGTTQQLYYIRQLNPSDKSLEGVIILQLDKTQRVREKMMAESAVQLEGTWVLKNVSTYSMDRKGRLLGEPKLLSELALPKMSETYEDFVKAAKESEFLSYKELKYYVDHLKESGLEVRSQKVDLYHKLSFPWSSLIMMLAVIPFLSKTLTKRGIALTVLQCLFIVFGYHAFDAIALALGKSGALPGFISAWLGSCLFGASALLFLERANQ